MKSTFLIILFSILLFSCKQEKIIVIVSTFPNGKPKTIRHFLSKEDSKISFEVLDSNGIGTATKPVTFFEEGFYENGNIQFRGEYIKGQTCGLWEYFYEDGKYEAKCYYNNGICTDSVFCWDPSGKRKRELFEFDTIKKMWHNTDYFENGRISVQCTQYQDSSGEFVLDGTYEEWYENGNRKLVTNVRNSQSIGKPKYYDSLGFIEKDSVGHISISLK